MSHLIPLENETAALTSCNVAARLHLHAVARPTAVAIRQPVVWLGRKHYRDISFWFTLLWTQRYVGGLRAMGVQPGMRVVLMVPPSHELVRLVYALLQLGAVLVLIDPGIGIKNLGKCIAEAEPDVFIGIRKAQIARWLFGWGKRTLKQFITVRQIRFTDAILRHDSIGPGKCYPFFIPQIDDPAAILFTSGSTGVPKGAVYTHGTFTTQVDALQRIFGIEPGEIDLCTFPLFALFAPALGMTSIVPLMDFARPARVQPYNILGPAREFGVTNLFGSPALLNAVVGGVREFHEDDQGFSPDEDDLSVHRIPRLKRVLSAGAPVSSNILEQFLKLIPDGVQIYTPYGATEALPVAVIGSDEVLLDTRHQTARGAGTCVGRPVTGLDVRIIRISDEPIAAWSADLVLPPGEIGEIAVYGPQVTQEYFRRPDLTALAKIPDTSRGRKWHRMGDVGYFDEQGRLWFCGRKSQRVITPERTYFTDPVEGIFNAVPGVFRTALVGVKQNGVMMPALCVELERGAKPPAVMCDELLQRGSEFELTRDIRTILFHPRFPVDIRHNSKIFREKLAVWAAKQR